MNSGIYKITSPSNKIYVGQSIHLENNLLGEFVSLREASRQLGICSGSISKVCKGKQKQAKGFIFKYKQN